MKVLMLNASPWRNGNISVMLDAMRVELEYRGMVVEMEYVNELSMHPCVGCMRCRIEHECCLAEDDAHRIARKLYEYDLFIIGAPCYWGNMPGTLKLLFDRMVYVMIDTESPGLLPRPLLKGKKAIIVSASTTPSAFEQMVRTDGRCGKIFEINISAMWYKTHWILSKRGYQKVSLKQRNMIY